jgi:HPt (histidine-containing phosphotransfer) domain-containing protein
MNPAEVIDLEHLRRTTQGDAALEAELFGMFREQCALWLRVLDPKGEAETWKSATHALKGMARGLGAFAFGDACEAAEELAGEAGTPVARSLALQTLRAAMDEALAAAAKLDHRAGASFRSAAER